MFFLFINLLKEKIEPIYGQYRELWKDNLKVMLAGHFVFVVLLLLLVTYTAFIKAPSDFPDKALLSIEEGQTLSEIASLMEEKNIVKSAFWFKNTVIYLKGENKVIAGDYSFEKPQNSYAVAQRIIKGEFNLYPIRITVNEGMNVFEMAEMFSQSLVKFDKNKFIKLAEEKEGFLFPDTYFFMPNTKTEAVISAMEKNFEEKTSEIKEKIENLEKSLEEIITLASIIEAEAGDSESRRVISGILWSRLEIGMPLQVDVTFKYINGKNTYELTSDDLKVDSPYNTYVYAGLPPTPINNPGLDSILAAVDPVETEYLYFMSDMRGNMYYAVTHDEHVENKRLYLYN